MITITQKQAANYLLYKAGFNSQRNFLEVINDLSCVQVDPLNIVARSHELVLYNRAKNFVKADLYKALYQDYSLFEYWMQLYSIIPIASFPYLHSINEVPGDRQTAVDTHWQVQYEKQHKRELEQVLEFITKNGPTSAKQLAHLPKGSAVHSWKGDSSHTALLEFLWNVGKIQISRRQSNAKLYDLTERIIPEDILSTHVTAEESYKFLLDSYFKYQGFVGRRFFIRSGRDRAFGIREEVKKQLRLGEILEIQIQDTKNKYFVKASELDVINSISDNYHEGLTIVAPLDPLIINRELTLDVFGFFYRWEAYTPAVKRKFGYYNMPILYQGRFVGQIDLAKGSKTERVLLVKALHVDRKSKALDKALKEEIERLSQFAYS